MPWRLAGGLVLLGEKAWVWHVAVAQPRHWWADSTRELVQIVCKYIALVLLNAPGVPSSKVPASKVDQLFTSTLRQALLCLGSNLVWAVQLPQGTLELVCWPCVRLVGLCIDLV